MIHSLKCLPVFAIALLGACATPISTTLAFGPSSPKALLVMAGLPAVAAETTEFRRVDLEKGEFRPEVITVVNGGLAGNQINGETKAGVWLSPQEIGPGAYALVSISTATYNGVSSGSRYRCMHGGTPVYALSAGKIGIVRIEPYRLGDPSRKLTPGMVASDEDVLKEFAIARTRYADISGEATIIKPTAVINYADKQPDIFESANRSCAEPPTFTRIP